MPPPRNPRAPRAGRFAPWGVTLIMLQAQRVRSIVGARQGAFLGCCRVWQEIRILPHVCRYCQQVYLQESPHAPTS